MSDKRGPTHDSALEAMIAERFLGGDAEVWQEAAEEIRALFGRWERRLPPEMWRDMQRGLDIAATTGNPEPLVAAASIAQYELRRSNKERMIDRKRRTSRKLKVAVPPKALAGGAPPKITD